MAQPETSQHREAFESWYGNKREFRKTSQSLARNLRTLYDWSDRFSWYERADARDQAAQRIADTAAAQETAKFLKAQQQAGQLLRLKGIKHLSEHDIDDGRTAIAAIKTGVELERQAMGLPDWIAKILTDDADTLTNGIADMERRRREAFVDNEGTAGEADTAAKP